MPLPNPVMTPLPAAVRPLPVVPRTVTMVATMVVPLMATLMAGCASPGADEAPDPPPVAMKHQVVAALGDGHLVRFNAGDPARPKHRVALQGLQPGETLVGVDFRVARGVLYALSSRGRLLTVDVASGRLTPVGPGVVLDGSRFGVDFNPTVDRLRVVSDRGQNLRLHPDTGALVSADPALSATGPVAVTAAGYTYNKANDKLTTNYAIDAGAGLLVRQGSVEGVQPMVSPNTGRIEVVGPLGTGPVADASLDIADTDNTALAALTTGSRTRLVRIDLASGRAQVLGTLARGVPVWGIAIEP
jgi:hypothetical protein